jgi:hypothetical protein
MIISGGKLPFSLLFLFIALTSCSNDTAVPYPADTKWVQVGMDPTITIHHNDGMPLVNFDAATSSITIARSFNCVIAWKEGIYVNMVVYNGNSNGAVMIRVIPSETKVVYFTSLVGIGQIEHSQYHNDLDIYLNKDLVMIVGRESSGNYKEIRRIADGSLINVSQEYTAESQSPGYIKVK